LWCPGNNIADFAECLWTSECIINNDLHTTFVSVPLHIHQNCTVSCVVLCVFKQAFDITNEKDKVYEYDECEGMKTCYLLVEYHESSFMYELNSTLRPVTISMKTCLQLLDRST